MGKRTLIVVAKLSCGGTNSSLKNFLSCIHSHEGIDIDLFVMAETSVQKLDYPNIITFVPKVMMFNSWYGTFSDFTFLFKVISLPIKILKKIRSRVGKGFPNLIFKHVAQTARFSDYDNVIAFSEGDATRFASFIKAEKHYAWVHCNLKYSSIQPDKEILFYSKYDQIFAVSKYTANICRELFPSIKEKFNYIYNVIDYSKVWEKSNEMDRDLDFISESDTMIVSIGRIDPIKHFTIIPQIASEVSKQISNLRWIIIGDGSQNEKNIINENIRKFGVEDIVFLVGYKSNPMPFLKRANLYVCTSISEACPMVFLEANALNTYILSTGFPSAYEILNDKLGKICSVDTMSSQIVSILRERECAIYDTSFTRKSITDFLTLIC